MIINYKEQSETVELHSHKHNICTHVLEDGWECTCSECRCDAVINIQAAYDWVEDHKVIVKINPGLHHQSSAFALTPERARALASLLYFAANDAETLNKEFPSDEPAGFTPDTSEHFPSTEDADGF